MLNGHDGLHIAVGAIETLSLICKFSVKLKLKIKLKSQLKKDEKSKKEFAKFLEGKKHADMGVKFSEKDIKKDNEKKPCC